MGRRGLGSLKMKLFQKTGGNRSTLDSKLAPLTSDVMASFCIYAKESATPLSQPPKVCETQFQDTDPTGQRIMLSERNHMRLQHVKEVHDWRRMLWANRRYTQDKHGLDHMLWGHMSNTAHTRVSEKVTKKQVMLPVIYDSPSFSLPRQPDHSTQSSCLHLFLWHHPVIIFSLKFLWWKMSHRFLPTQAGACGMPFFWGVPGQGATQRLLQTLFPHHLGKNASGQAPRWSSSWWSYECGWEPEYKLATPVGHTVQRME